ncbi:DUF2511 domain-containing protein [Escherichia coli]|nr:DUF2511 domain-containing protein [Escherichia coli]
MMKKSILAFLLLTSSAAALAAPQVITVSRFEVGKDKWAFNREEVMLTCRPRICHQVSSEISRVANSGQSKSMVNMNDQ